MMIIDNCLKTSMPLAHCFTASGDSYGVMAKSLSSVRNAARSSLAIIQSSLRSSKYFLLVIEAAMLREADRVLAIAEKLGNRSSAAADRQATG